jgi:hypothetical protein
MEGKTKRVYGRPDGNLEFHFKDDATGYIDPDTGEPVFDSGYDRSSGRSRGRVGYHASSRGTSSSSLTRREFLRTTSGPSPITSWS